MNNVVLKYLKEQGYDNVSTKYYEFIEAWENWWRNEVDFHKYHDQTGKERKMYTLGMAKRVSEDWSSILFTERDEITTEASTDEQSKANNEYLSKQLKDLRVYKDLPTAIEKAMATGTAGASNIIFYLKENKLYLYGHGEEDELLADGVEKIYYKTKQSEQITVVLNKNTTISKENSYLEYERK